MLAKIGENLRKARIGAGWTQKDLADRSGISMSMVSAVERGQRNVTLETLQALASALGQQVSVDLVVDNAALSSEDEALLLRLQRLLPRLDPALKATLIMLVGGWEQSSSFVNCQKGVKTG